ncbi:Crp/Fnr family transcriptional regulator [Rhizobiaceae bacterium BDR2-2]|uniref:Crp/Fnr family transcriptional regulator n=1 Tax=Ectorhizobium quercum TaxID=2965071 RepID=A0AAE3MZN1_9HYPH|nr:Crp/Fnr family transcriptional regulator [Ectorhizobium quercum]MCX8997391.1 Crp/Fnr family transcriptional regulator [Ectorhizobium quercum]
MAAATTRDLGDNILLAKLRDEDRARLHPHLSSHDLHPGDILQKAGDEVNDTWFPCGPAIASFQIWADDDNGAVEVAMIGREGAIGGIVSNGRVPAYATAQVRAGGRFLRIRTAVLEQVKLESLPLRHWFSRYSDCLIAQIFQNSACNASHTITQRAAKWLLAASARTGSTEVALTQEQLAQMLGVGRTFVTRIVRQLREDGLIATRRGVFILQNIDGLKSRSCTCADSIEQHFEIVLDGVYPELRQSG